MPLHLDNPVADYRLGDFVARYQIDPHTRRVTFLLLPETKVGEVVERRVVVDTPLGQTGQSRKWPAVLARKADSLVQVKLRGDGCGAGFALGRTMRNGPSVERLVFEEQTEVATPGGGRRIETVLAGEGFRVRHRLDWSPGDLGVIVSAEIENTAAAPCTVEMLSSFCLNELTPFARDDAPGRLFAHRFRSTWSSEGRHECLALEDLHLERSWAGHSHQSERFGQVGTQPVRGWFPFVGLEDREAGVLWGARLAWGGMQQIWVQLRVQ